MQSILPVKSSSRKIEYWWLLAAVLLLSGSLSAQTVTLTVKEAPLKKVFAEIKKQTGYNFLYASEYLEGTRPVSFSVRQSPLPQVLDLCFENQPITYAIEEKFIVISRRGKDKESIEKYALDVSGRVLNEKGEGLEGATITVRGSGEATATNNRGEFSLKQVPVNATLYVSSVGYQPEEFPIKGRSLVTIPLSLSVQLLEETIIKGYYSTSKKLNTGNVSKVNGVDIQKQPVSSPLQALEGRVPGLEISQTNGLTGSAVKVQIRGRNSIAQGSEPLFVIDGVPLVTGNISLSQVFSALNANASLNGISPFFLFNPSDIESIEILKDADATSIYGSRGANGVVLITTKKGKEGKTNFQLNFYNGFSKVTRTMDLLSTPQYLAMRKEAFQNDGVTPDNNNAYDLLLWDTTRYTDFKKMLIGGTAATRDVQASVSGGNANTQFLIGGGYHHETTVFPGNFATDRGSLHFSMNHASENKKFTTSLVGYYSFSKNNILTTDLSSAVGAVPNLPELYDSLDHLNWNSKGISFVNPLSFLKKTYDGQTHLLNSNLLVHYQISDGLSLSSTFGYNRSDMNEISTNPIGSQNPAVNPNGSSSFGSALAQGWIIEPQLKYNRKITQGKMEFQLGGTFQRNTNSSTLVNAGGYTSDYLLKDVNAAATATLSDDYKQYKYQALFGRFNYNWKDRYILNLTGRRDGSSRFGPGRQFANFGSAGFAWIFSHESFLKRIGILSYGKLRGSYGASGNDQIGDYRFLSAWTSSRYTYQGSSGLYPNNLFNPDYSWEFNRKLEAALELGFWNNRIFLSASYFKNRSSNQLLSYQLPYQTGFFDIIENFPALVQNTGWELEVRTKNLQGPFTWSTSLNLTVPRNKLIAFPGMESSSYSYLVTGQPLSLYSGFHFLGVDPATGVYQFSDKEGKPTSIPSSTTDYIKNLGNLDPRFYGGLLNSFSYKSISLDVFFEFKKQMGANYLNFLTSNLPGSISNQFVNVLDRWQKPGDVTGIQRFTESSSSAASKAANYFRQFGNDGKYSDASYVRLKNIYLAYTFPTRFMDRLHLQTARIFVQGQNLLTMTPYVGADPETMNVTSLPPLKTFTAGIQLGF